MNVLVETSAAASIAVALVNLFKFARPEAPSWALALVSLIVGIGATFVVSLASGEIVTTQLAAQNVLQGVAVAMVAAGLDRVSAAASQTRTVAKAIEMDQIKARIETNLPVERERLVP